MNLQQSFSLQQPTSVVVPQQFSQVPFCYPYHIPYAFLPNINSAHSITANIAPTIQSQNVIKQASDENDPAKVLIKREEIIKDEQVSHEEQSQSHASKLPGGLKNSHWTQEEHEKYVEFVEQNKHIFRSKYEKKSKKIFKLMSQAIPTRSATQCRSHHQKFNPLNRKLNRRRRKLLIKEIKKEVTGVE